VKLTAKQIRFVDEYMVDFNATQAAIRAGYKAKTAHVIGAENLRKPKIAEEIARRQKDLQRRTEVTQDRVVKELARVAFADATDYACVETLTYENEDGTVSPVQIVSPKDTDTLSDDQRAAIAGIKHGANGIEVKLHDKIKALELLGRHIGMFNDKLSLSGADGGPLTFRWEGKDG
jgi:phage terminase small subunit